MTKSRKQSEKKKITLKFIFLSAFFILSGLFIIILPFINIKIDYVIIEKDIKVQSIKQEHQLGKGHIDYLLTADSKEKFRIEPGYCLKEFDEEVKTGNIAQIKYYKTKIFGINHIEELSANGKMYVSQDYYKDYFKNGSKVIPIVLGSIIFFIRLRRNQFRMLRY